jgi:hypothetical protein
MRHRLTCHIVDRDNQPVEGAIVRVVVVMKVKHHHVWYSDGTDADGKLVILDLQVINECLKHTQMLPDRWADLSDETVERVLLEIPPANQLRAAALEDAREDLLAFAELTDARGPIVFADPPFNLNDETIAEFGESVIGNFDSTRKFMNEFRARRRKALGD